MSTLLHLPNAWCLSQAKFHCLHVWDAYFYIGTPTLFVKRGICMGCLFSQRDAHIYCENGHPGCVFLGMPIFT